MLCNQGFSIWNASDNFRTFMNQNKPKMKTFFYTLFLSLFPFMIAAQSVFSVNGLSIAAPNHDDVEKFVEFIEKELGPAGINTLVLRVDYNYAYKSRPQLQNENPLTEKDVKKIVMASKKHGIEIVPQINLFGHQSWHSNLGKLLEVYPEFDETPHVKLPEKYEWPNEDGLYCKSYCPRHPEVHDVVFDLMDEIMEVFEAKAFHAGLDEVFYIADPKCPRCKGADPAALFAEEVTTLSNHLEEKGSRLWIWGDRLIDASTADLGMWEASMNNTARAIDMIPKTVVICDWHYERAIPTPAYFALKGFDVIACPYRKAKVAEAQVKMMSDFKHNSTPETSEKFLGVMHTVWSSAEKFLEEYYNPTANDERGSPVDCFKAMTNAVKKIDEQNSEN